jgi:flagellar M-ring protein FliF
MSVAVLVDGSYQAGDNGQQVYVPRSKEELTQIDALVRSAIGFDAVRGDSIEVVNMRFTAPDGELADTGITILGMQKDDLFRIAEMVVLAIVALLIILLVVRPLMARAFERSQESSGDDDDAERLLTDQSGSQAQLMAPGALAQDLALEEAQADEELEQMIDISRVEGRVRASSLRKVGEIVDKHPEEAVSIIRNWLYQET